MTRHDGDHGAGESGHVSLAHGDRVGAIHRIVQPVRQLEPELCHGRVVHLGLRVKGVRMPGDVSVANSVYKGRLLAL